MNHLGLLYLDLAYSVDPTLLAYSPLLYNSPQLALHFPRVFCFPFLIFWFLSIG